MNSKIRKEDSSGMKRKEIRWRKTCDGGTTTVFFDKNDLHH